jgi:hypothetical protein
MKEAWLRPKCNFPPKKRRERDFQKRQKLFIFKALAIVLNFVQLILARKRRAGKFRKTS